MKKNFLRILALALCVALLTGCASGLFGSATLNGIAIEEFTIVYSETAPDYCQRAARYIQAQILERTGQELPVCTAQSGNYDHELLVGDTDRPLSAEVKAENISVEFYLKADENHIAINGPYFVIAAAAYYFVQTYIPGEKFESVISTQQLTAAQPITQAPANVIFLIGDGMGENHTKLVEEYDISLLNEDSDGERVFYGNFLPYRGMIGTGSLTGITDSAASATALACGYKTANGRVGRDEAGNDLQSLTELAASLGMATGIMSTDLMTGATPSGFSAHAMDRDDSKDILNCQTDLMLRYKTVFQCGLHSSASYEQYITDTLAELEQNEKGFFLMYEEGYIDKFAHQNNMEDTVKCVGRFNQAIGLFMEYAFYHPDTFLIITADHETGGLMPDERGKLQFHSEEHTGTDVPIYGYGQGAEVFDGARMENSEIPGILAALWGVENFGQS